ncbi:MAG: NUDIX domain-containing protein [Candidatus Promineifilaceae bacterium]
METSNTPERTSRETDGASPIQTTSSRVVWSCDWFKVRQDEVLLRDGTAGEFNVVQHDGAVWIVPITSEGEIVLLKHYRYSVDEWCWEIPAGGLKPHASMEETAVAELEEEIGGFAGSLQYIGQFYTSNGISNEVANIFLASDVSLGQPRHEPAEIMEVHVLPMETVLAMAHNNEISDGPSALALLICEQRIRNVCQKS